MILVEVQVEVENEVETKRYCVCVSSMDWMCKVFLRLCK